MTPGAKMKILCETGSSKNKKRHAIRCEHSRIEVDDRQLMIERAAGVCRELRDQFLASHNRKPPWSTKAFVRTVRDIEHHDVVSSGTFADECSDKNPQMWTKQASTTLVDATEAYMLGTSQIRYVDAATNFL